jgi:glucose/arabinose dehydrogenase
MSSVQRRAATAAMLATLALGPGACGGGNGDPTSPTTPTPSPTSVACSVAPVTGTPALTSQRVASGLRSPLDLQSAPGDRERLYVVEQDGRIQIVRNGQVSSSPFLDIAGRISSGGERGLLGLAFHPQFATSRRFFVNYTDPQGDTRIAEFRAPSADQADPQSERQLLFVAQPFPNHNGGGLAFGNDGMLYIGLGDGGSGGDPQGNGQNLGTALGKMLRIDVDRGSPFAVPSDNPFTGRAGALATIWAYGLRNPFRFSFDRSTGDLYIGDVGQNQLEEIDVGLASRRGGENYGWNIMEGNACYQPASGCNTSGITRPVLDYRHSDGCSVSGGVVYHGCRMPGHAGTYFYSDYCSSFIRSFRLQGGAAADPRDWTAQINRGQFTSIVSFGTDQEGEVYVVDLAGSIYKIIPAS